MSIASMLIPPTVKAELSPEYPESDCQQQSSPKSTQDAQSQQRTQDCAMPTDCSAFRPKSPRKPASEGFSTPPVTIATSGLPSAFKAPHSVPSFVSLGNATADDLSCRAYYGSPDTPEIEDLEIDTTKGKVTLWQFLLQLLMDPRYVDIIRWTNNAGEFVLLRAEEVARLWGLRKDNNHRMNYDKLSRALRYYYQKNIIRKVQGHKFVYQFIGLQRFNLSNRPQGMEKAIIDSSPPPPPAEQAKHQRRQSAPNKPSFNVSSDSALIGYSPFQKHANPFAESLLALKQQQQQHQQITIPQTLSTTTQDASKLNQSIFEQVFPANLSQSLDYGVSSTSTPTSSTSQSTNNSSSSSSSFHPVYSNSACDLSKLYANLPKNNEPLHLSHRVDENMSGAMDLHTCKEMMAHAFLPHDRPAAKRSCSPNCHCSCHDSLTSHKSCENRPMHYNQPANLTQSHSGTAVNPVGGFRKPRPIDCWTPLRGGNQLGDHLVMQSAALDQRSVLHWQRHMINMNRFKEQIERFSVWTGGEERKVLPLQSHSISQSQPRQTQAETIIRPCDVLRVGSEAMDTEPACLRESSQCSSNSENQSSSSSCGSSGSGNYIWMPIQVDLVEHFMSMISQTIQDNKSMEPPAAHSSSNP